MLPLTGRETAAIARAIRGGCREYKADGHDGGFQSAFDERQAQSRRAQCVKAQPLKKDGGVHHESPRKRYPETPPRQPPRSWRFATMNADPVPQRLRKRSGNSTGRISCAGVIPYRPLQRDAIRPTQDGGGGPDDRQQG